MVLGIIASRPKAHGYHVYRELMAWRADSWHTVQPGSIYHALSQLEKEDLIERLPDGNQDTAERSDTVQYAITDEGCREFRRLVRESLTSYDHETFAAGLAFMRYITREQALVSARQRLETYQQICASMRHLVRSEDGEHPSQHPAIIDSWTTVFDATLAWQQNFIATIEAGEYTFADAAL